MGLPASVRNCALAWSRIISWSFRDAQKRADHLHRHLRTEIGDEVESVRYRSAGPGLRAQYSRILGSSALILRGVKIPGQ